MQDKHGISIRDGRMVSEVYHFHSHVHPVLLYSLATMHAIIVTGNKLARTIPSKTLSEYIEPPGIACEQRVVIKAQKAQKAQKSQNSSGKDNEL